MSVFEATKNMSVFDCIKRRRSVSKMTLERPTHEQVERVLEAATYAPNHHKIEPWKFFVLTGTACEELAMVMANAKATRSGIFASDRVQAKLDKARRKALQAPVVIAVVIEGVRYLKGMEVENIAAASAAVQNMLLAADAQGLATLWRTGDAAYDPSVKKWFGLAPEDHIIAFVYLGFATHPPKQRVPTHFSQKTAWFGWDEPITEYHAPKVHLPYE
jgi:nitroreductase